MHDRFIVLLFFFFFFWWTGTLIMFLHGWTEVNDFHHILKCISTPHPSAFSFNSRQTHFICSFTCKKNHMLPAHSQQPCFTWISSSFTRLMERCDLTNLLLCLLILANLFSLSLILFHSLHHYSPHSMPSVSTSRLCLTPPRFLASFPADIFFTAAPHTPLLAAASLLKVQSRLLLLPWQWRH